jgi:Family of unknown function (DUF6232)
VKPTHSAGLHASPGLRRHGVVLCAEPGILVTTESVQVRGAWHPVGELTGLRVARGSSGPAPAACAVGGVLAATVGEATRAAGPGDPVLVTAVSALVAGGLALAAAVAYWRRPLELWAQCHGDWMLIYASRDAVPFGKVCRAVERATGRRG